MIGSVSRRNGRVARSDGPSARAAGRRRREGRAELLRERVGGGERGARLLERARQEPQRLADVLVLRGERAEVRVGRDDELRELLVLGPDLVRQRAEVVDHAAEVPAPLRQLAVDLREVAVGGLEPLERGAQVCARPPRRRTPRRPSWRGSSGSRACPGRAGRGSRRGSRPGASSRPGSCPCPGSRRPTSCRGRAPPSCPSGPSSGAAARARPCTRARTPRGSSSAPRPRRPASFTSPRSPTATPAMFTVWP